MCGKLHHETWLSGSNLWHNIWMNCSVKLHVHYTGDTEVNKTKSPSMGVQEYNWHSI
ncbi:hypothetical protein L336_0816 [Candidatus Saccharimonas aalborgensis]|uniref:Uncharacterized protein n=1 Tax=Candidatus Saccharimonas aalborgensis TaxID=1332188 RepID=R4PLL8_9BACT|nr:hypothetical protein L336_0816 [Candidatus Saccharimonas aalborgensis]